MNKEISFEEELIKTINLIATVQDRELFEQYYFSLCEAVAIKHLKSKGFCNIPFIGDILYYVYDKDSKEYRSSRESIGFSMLDKNSL